MTWKEVEIKSWADLVNFFESLDIGHHLDTHYLFRGQSNAKWSLTPSLFRATEEHALVAEDLKELERAALKHFKTQAHQYLTPSLALKYNDCSGWWSLMQHYGAPTRLLDWTKSAYVSAYFAVNENFNESGCVWFFDVAKLQTETKRRTSPKYSIPTDDKDSESWFFENETPCRLYAVEPNVRTDRMSPQQGYFTVAREWPCDHGALIENFLQSCQGGNLYTRLIIPSALKLTILRKLRTMNITGQSLFPGLDGLGRCVGEMIRLPHENWG